MFREALKTVRESDKTFDQYKMDIYKDIKKRFGVSAVYLGKDFKATKTYNFDSKVTVHFNDKDYDKPVYDIEWR